MYVWKKKRKKEEKIEIEKMKGNTKVRTMI